MNDKYVLGIDFGTGGVRVGIFDLKGNEIAFESIPVELYTPKPSYAEQSPDEWYEALGKASKGAIKKANVNPNDIIGIGTDTTACTLVFLDKENKPLRNAIMWMDMRGAEQAKRIAKCGHDVLKFNGYGNVSPEWMQCKTLWVKENEPDIYNKTQTIMACADWLGYVLTGRMIMNLNCASARWYYDYPNGGFQKDFFEAIGLEDAIEKIPKDILRLGDKLGELTSEIAEHMGLVQGIPVAVGGADAYVAMLALGVTRPGKAALITGSSHLMLFLADKEIHAKGLFGGYPESVIKDQCLMEAGQTSTGSIVNWFKTYYSGNIEREIEGTGKSVYDYLNEKAEKLPIGSDGLICLDYFQGNRTPYTDGEVRGMIAGLTLSHKPEHIYKALIESICYGTEVIFRNFERAGVRPKELFICGGATKCRWWLQAHADISNIPINIPKVSEAPALGSAIMGAVVGGAYPDMPTASDNMVEMVDRIEPNLENHRKYKYYVDMYEKLYPMMKDWMHDVVSHK